MATVYGTDKILYFNSTCWPDGWIYSFNDDNWTELNYLKKPLFKDRYFATATVWGDEKILLFGGLPFFSHQVANETWVFDMGNKTWTKKKPPCRPWFREGHSISTIYNSNKIILFGGFIGHKKNWYLDDTWIYDFKNNTWVKKVCRQRPEPRKNHAMAPIYNTDKILLFGGATPLGTYPYTWIYDLNDNSWTMISPPNYPSRKRSNHAMASIYGYDKVLLFGGDDSNGDETWIYDLSEDNWTQMKPNNNPSARTLHSMTTINGKDKIILFGGVDSNHNLLDDTWIYDFSENKWTKKNPNNKPSARKGHDIANIHGSDQILLYGGWNNDTWIYDLSENEWKKKYPKNIPFPFARSTFAMATVNGTKNIILFGERLCNDELWRDETWVFNKYVQKGTYISEPLDISSKSTFFNITWDANNTINTSVYFQLRTSFKKSNLLKKDFIGPDGLTASYYTSPGENIWYGHFGDKFLQYKVFLYTSNLNETPILNNVSIIFNKWPNTILSKPINNSWININKPFFEWNFKDNDSLFQKGFQWQLDDHFRFSSIDYDSDKVFSKSQNYTPHSPIPDGIWYWHVRTLDNDGDWSLYSDYQIINIDTKIKTPLNLAITPNIWSSINNFIVNWTNPYDLSGIAGVYFKLNTPPNSSTDGKYISRFDINSINNISVIDDGEHTLFIWLKDKANNSDYTKNSSSKIYYDSTAPSQPINITVNPSYWTSINSFDIKWENPKDLSGISGAYYKLDSKPLSNTDGVFLSAKEIDNIENLGLSSEGEHTIYIWLIDGAGNVYYNNFGSAKLYLDSSSPPPPEKVIVDSKGWTNTDVFNIDWTLPDNSFFIKEGAYYYFGTIPPASQNNGKWSDMKPFNITVRQEGETNIYLWLEDIAGNSNYNKYRSAEIKYDITPPSISHTPILTGKEGEEIIITVNAEDTLSGPEGVKLYYKSKLEDNYKDIIMEYSVFGYKAKIDKNDVTVDGLEYYLKATDKAGNSIYLDSLGETEIIPTPDSDFDISIKENKTITIARPKIIDNSPKGTEVSITVNITIVFDKPMNKSSVKNAILITPTISGKIYWSSIKLIYTPDKPLAYNTTYHVTISKTAKDIEDYNLKEDFVWSFTTEKEDIIDGKENKTDNTQKGGNLSLFIGIILIVIFIIIILIYFLVIKKKKPTIAENSKPLKTNDKISISNSKKDNELQQLEGSKNYPSVQNQNPQQTFQSSQASTPQNFPPIYPSQQNKCGYCHATISNPNNCPYCGWPKQQL